MWVLYVQNQIQFKNVIQIINKMYNVNYVIFLFIAISVIFA